MNKKPELDNQEARTNIDEGAKAASTSSRGLGRGRDRNPIPSSQTSQASTNPPPSPDGKDNSGNSENSTKVANPTTELSHTQSDDDSNSTKANPGKVKHPSNGNSDSRNSKSKQHQDMILALSGLVVIASIIIAVGIYLSQNQQQPPIKPTPITSPTDTPSTQPPELSIPDINRLNKSELESLYKKIEAELNKLQQSKKNPSNDSQRIAEIDRAISAYENQKIEINRAIANINAANIDDKDKLQQIKNSLIAYDNIEKLKSIDCNQKTQVTKVFDDAIARLKRFAPSSPIYTEAQDLTNNYTKIRSDFPNQCKKAQTSPATTTPVNPTDTSVDTPPIQGAPPEPPVNEGVRDLPPDVTVKNSEKIAPQSQQFQNDDVPDLPSDVKVRESGKITP